MREHDNFDHVQSPSKGTMTNGGVLGGLAAGLSTCLNSIVGPSAPPDIFMDILGGPAPSPRCSHGLSEISEAGKFPIAFGIIR